MPRLNIDDDVWPKFDLLAKRLNWRHQDVMCSMIYLWKKTQELQKLYCTLDEIALFARLRSKKKVHEFVIACSHPDVRLLTVCEQPIDRLLTVCEQPIDRLLTDYAQPVYRISGNKKHIDALNSYKERGKLGGRPASEKAIALKNENPLHNITKQYTTYINPPIIGESSNLEENKGEGDDKKLSELVRYAEMKFGVTATKLQKERWKTEATGWDLDTLKKDIDFIAGHPKASAETKSISRAFHAAEVGLAMGKWDNRLRIEIRRTLDDGAKPSEVSDLIVSGNPKYDEQKLRNYVQKIINRWQLEK